MKQSNQRGQHIAGGQGDAFRVTRGDDLGHDFAEHHQRERQRECAEQDSQIVLAEQAQDDDVGHGGGGDIEQCVAKQDRAEQLVHLAEQGGGQTGAAVAFAHQTVETAAIDRHHAGLRAGEERAADQQDEQNAEQCAKGNIIQSVWP